MFDRYWRSLPAFARRILTGIAVAGIVAVVLTLIGLYGYDGYSAKPNGSHAHVDCQYAEPTKNVAKGMPSLMFTCEDETGPRQDGPNGVKDQSEYDFVSVSKSVARETVSDPVALFTVILAFSTIFLWLETRKSTGIAASALRDLERPYVFIYGMGPVEALPQDGGRPRCRYLVSNNGKLAAKIERVSVRFGADHAVSQLTADAKHALLERPILSSDEVREWNYYELSGSPLVRRKRINRRISDEYDLADGVILQVVIAYRGPSTKGHETAQCWRYESARNRWFEIDDPQHTYMK